jgi:hypothetical protein
MFDRYGHPAAAAAVKNVPQGQWLFAWASCSCGCYSTKRDVCQDWIDDAVGLGVGHAQATASERFNLVRESCEVCELA